MTKIAVWSIFPVIGWAVTTFLALLMAIPVHFLWSWLAPTYLAFLPVVYLQIGLIDMAGMLVLIGFLKLVFLPAAFNNVFKSKEPK